MTNGDSGSKQLGPTEPTSASILEATLDLESARTTAIRRAKSLLDADQLGVLSPSMHARCLIVDESHALVGSANFTTRAEDRNLELGLLLHDPTLIANLTRHWRTAIHEGGVVRG